MSRELLDEVYDATIQALSAAGRRRPLQGRRRGLPRLGEVVAWTERVKALVLHQRDRGSLRAELPALGERLLRFLARLPLAEGADAEAVVVRFVAALPGVRARLAEDVEAAFEGDPAARSFGEIVAAYPSIHAIAIYRLAHELHALGVPQLPRIMSEHAHARTGIDIHPGARIGRRFFIDHGTGVVDRRDQRDRRPRARSTRASRSARSRRAGGRPCAAPSATRRSSDDVTIYAGRDDSRRRDGDRQRPAW